jgi:gas vesicle protein
LTDTQYLEKLIVESGKKKSYLAEKIGCSRQYFRMKCNNEAPFTVVEVNILCEELNITKLSEKENEMYDSIKKKMNAANEAIKDFSEKAVATIKEIIEKAKDGVTAGFTTVVTFLQKMMEFVKNGMKKIGEGVVFACSLPIIFVYIVYKGVVAVCEKLVEGVKDGAKLLADVFVKVKNAITSWVSDVLAKAKDLFIKAGKAIKDGAIATAKAIGRGFLTFISIVGQLASDVKDAIKDAYNSFIESAKEFAEAVKVYISEKWEVVTNWCKNTATAFAEGVKNVWGKIKDTVKKATEAVSDAYKTLKDNAKATWEDIQKWNTSRKQEMFKAQMKYAIDNWGKDAVSSWIDEIE